MILDSLRTDHQYVSDFLICLVFVAVHPENRLSEDTHPLKGEVNAFEQFRSVVP